MTKTTLPQKTKKILIVEDEGEMCLLLNILLDAKEMELDHVKYLSNAVEYLEKENPSVNKEIEAGDTTMVLNWLRKNIHRYGREYTSEQLCKKATGEPLNSAYFIDYATKKYTAIYDL